MFIWNWHIFTVDALSPVGFASICFTAGRPLDMACVGIIVFSSMITVLFRIVLGFIIVFLLFFYLCKCIVFLIIDATYLFCSLWIFRFDMAFFRYCFLYSGSFILHVLL